ncbi:MAG: acyl-CoA dehydrogenase [Thermodesulfobacteriota bacterium]|jgi:alkylation response protein AidB-like acyl-CoA dehydrogenase
MGTNFFNRDDRDLRFVLFEYLKIADLLKYEAFKDFSLDDFEMIIQEAMKVSKEVIGPTNQDGDKEGCTYDNGEVKVPKSFHQVWKVMKENSWISLNGNPEFGGQGLPNALTGLINELFIAANMAFMTYPGLSISNARVIEHHGTEEDKALFLEKLNTGVWTGTMCLTEPNAGSDVGNTRAKAVPDPNSKDPRIYKIEGNKCFITCGNHDLAENIIHLVLAKIEGGPPGTKGISLFIVPKIWVSPDGTLGQPNDVFCSSIEHKMGIHGSSTASLIFGEKGGCRGMLLGQAHSGMAKMFEMMNEARMGCGVQTLGLTAAAYDTARQYAKERVQGPLLTNRRGESVTIIQHEDVRRMLMNLKSGTEAMRAMIGKLFYLIDISEYDPDEAARKKADSQVELLTPLVKAYISDFGYMLIRDAIQVLGGVGYCQEFPVEQYARDCKIVSIWEGTNYIQAQDLFGRKLTLNGGQTYQDWIQGIMTFAEQHKADPDFGKDCELLLKAAQATNDFPTRYMQYFSGEKIRLVPLTATRFLDCFAETLMANLMLEEGLVAREQLKGVAADSTDGIFYRGKIETVKFFCRNILPNVFARHLSLEMEDTSAIDIAEAAF